MLNFHIKSLFFLWSGAHSNLLLSLNQNLMPMSERLSYLSFGDDASSCRSLYGNWNDAQSLHLLAWLALKDH